MVYGYSTLIFVHAKGLSNDEQLLRGISLLCSYMKKSTNVCTTMQCKHLFALALQLCGLLWEWLMCVFARNLAIDIHQIQPRRLFPIFVHSFLWLTSKNEELFVREETSALFIESWLNCQMALAQGGKWNAADFLIFSGGEKGNKGASRGALHVNQPIIPWLSKTRMDDYSRNIGNIRKGHLILQHILCWKRTSSNNGVAKLDTKLQHGKGVFRLLRVSFPNHQLGRGSCRRQPKEKTLLFHFKHFAAGQKDQQQQQWKWHQK